MVTSTKPSGRMGECRRRAGGGAGQVGSLPPAWVRPAGLGEELVPRGPGPHETRRAAASVSPGAARRARELCTFFPGVSVQISLKFRYETSV